MDNETTTQKAKLFWGMDLDELERSFGIKDVLALPIAKIDTRVMPSDVILPPAYLPKE